MVNRRAVSLLVVALTAGLAAACGALGPTREVTFRIDVLADERVIGSSVMRVSARQTPSPFESAAQLAIHFTGEAVYLQPPGRPDAVMTLRASPSASASSLAGPAVFAMAGCDKCGGREDFWSSLGTVAGAWTAKSGTIPRENWPLIVAFRDLREPATVHAVEPERLGVTAVRATTVDGDVSQTLREHLPWLTGREERLQPLRGEGLATDLSFAQMLRHTHFRQGFEAGMADGGRPR